MGQLTMPRGACPAVDGGCKYTIVNTGNGARPELDPWIIIDP